MLHHHRAGSLKQQNKSHKSASSSNRELNRKLGGRVGRSNSASSSTLASNAAGRVQRRLQSVNLRKAKKEALLLRRRMGGSVDAPRCVLVVGLSAQAKPDEVASSTRSLATCTEVLAEEMQLLANGRLTYVRCSDVIGALDACKAADIVVVVLGLQPMSTTLATVLDGAVDVDGRALLTALKAQGLPTCLGAIQGLESVPEKIRAAAKKHASTFLKSELGADCKLVDLSAGAMVLARALVETKTHAITWRGERSYLLACDKAVDDEGRLVVRGHVRGRPLLASQLVHVCGVGTFEISRLTVLGDPLATQHAGRHMDELIVKDVAVDALPGVPAEEAEPDLMAGEQTWPTREEMGEDDDRDDGGGEAHDDDDEGREYLNAWLDDTDAPLPPPVEYASTRNELAKQDLQFPDELDTPEKTPARERFAKYRGLKSLRTSPWHPMESLPREYGYIHQLRDFRALQKSVLVEGEAMQAEWVANGTLPEGAVAPGSYVELRLAGAGAERAMELAPLVLGSLLEHETKLSVVNCLVQPLAVDEPVAARDELVLHCGLWRRAVRPTLSEHNLNSDKHKLERFAEAGRWTVASAYAPITFGANVPALLFRGDELVAAGSLLSVDPNRIVLKKVVLTGTPVRVKKGWAVVKRMFYAPEDVKWFKPVDLYTKYGASGRILDSVGTHGAMKCLFDRHITQQDTVCMALWKRVFPKPPAGMFAHLVNDMEEL